MKRRAQFKRNKACHCSYKGGCAQMAAMKPSADPAPRTQPHTSARLREIPSVDELIGRPRLRALSETAGRGVVTQVARNVLADVRACVLNEGSAAPAHTLEALEARIADEV